MTHSVDRSQPLSLAISVITQWADEQIIVARMEVIHGLNNMGHLFHQGQPAYNYCWVPSLPETEANNESPIWHHSSGYHQPPCRRSTILGYFHHERDRILFLQEEIHTVGTDLPSLHAVLLLKPPSLGLHNALSTVLIFHRTLFLIKKHSSQQKKYSDGSIFMKFTGLSIFLNPEAASLLDWMVDSLTVPARWQCLTGLGQDSSKGFTCSIQINVQYMVPFL